MYRTIEEHISDSIDDRTGDIINQLATFNRQYINLTNKIISVQQQILQFVPTESKDLFNEFEILWLERDEIKERHLYRHGVTDGIAIGNLISRNVKSHKNIEEA